MDPRVGLFGKWFRSDTGSDASPAPPPVVDQEVVIAALIAEVRAQGVTGEPRVQGNYLFVDEHGVSRHVFLGNLVREYAEAAVAARAELVAKYARLVARPVGLARPDLRAHVLPKLTPRKERHGQLADGLLAGRPLADGALVLELAVDEREAVRVVTASDLAGCELIEDDAYARAIANLRQRSTGAWDELVPGLFKSPWQDYFDGARLALPSLIRSLPIKGDPIAVIPNRCALLVTGSEEPVGLAVLFKATKMLMAKDRPVHVAPLVLDGDQWRELDVVADRDAVARAPSLVFLSSLQASLDLAMCSEQVRATLLARGFTHVGELGMLQGDDAFAATVAECPVGARVAVPKVDLIRFAGDSLVAWYKLEAMLGDDLVTLDVWPPHYELRRQPTDDEIAAARIKTR